jgi:dolichyldiphosphatase
MSQVVAGGVLGSICGFAWAALMHSHLVERVVYPWIEGTSIARYFYLKDSTHIENVLQFEYDSHHHHRKKLLKPKRDHKTS